MTKPKEPDYLIKWREWERIGIPKCCHSCYHFNEQGVCNEFDMRPPGNFADTQDACYRWEHELPF